MLLLAFKIGYARNPLAEFEVYQIEFIKDNVMKRVIYECLLQLAIILPLTLLFLKKYDKRNLQKIIVLAGIFICYQVILNLPKHFDFLKIIEGSWNWNGKILGILFGISCYFLFRSLFKEYDYFTFKQDKTNLKKTTTLSLTVVVLSSAIWFVFGKSEFDLETLFFQLTLPGVDEEIMYRGILLGLLMTASKEKIKFIGNPSILITSILFGLIHALNLGKDLTLAFNTTYFLQTGLAGYAWGWVTVKSRSILLALLSHNFSNFFGTLVAMIK